MPPAEREITAAVDLCRADGRLNPAAVGWSRRPLFRAAVPRGWPHRKRWHHWCVTSPAEVVTLTFADLDYLGLAAVVVIDLATGRTTRRIAVRPLGWGLPLPDDATGGEVTARHLGVALGFHATSGGMRLRARARGVRVDVEVARPPGHESLTVVIPMSERRFFLTTKENTLPAAGTIEIGRQARPIAGGAYACQDFGRGIWPHRTWWNWASASGRQGERTIGLNLGGRWTDGTGMDENALCVDGRLHPIAGEVSFAWDPRDPRRPWTVRGPSVDLRFAPVAVQRVRVPFGADMCICFGRFTGRIADHEVTDLFGWAEEVRVRW